MKTLYRLLFYSSVAIIFKRCKPLILKLRNPRYSLFSFGRVIKPENENERKVDELGEELIVCITQLMKLLTVVFSHLLTDFNELFDQLWEDIQYSTQEFFESTVSKTIEPFLEHIQTTMKALK